MHRIKGFHEDCRRVVKLLGPERELLHASIVQATELDDEQLIINLLQLLSGGVAAPKTYLNNEAYAPLPSKKENSRMNEVLEYTLNHYDQKITIETVAGVACLSRSRFSSFFKLHTGKTYVRFLNDLRIEHACSKLKTSTATVEQICYDVGFRNVSNFTRQFRQLKGKSPAAFRQEWQL